MSGMIRKVRRKMGTFKSPRSVEKINDDTIKDAMDTGEDTVMILHPTMGYRKMSLAKLKYIGNTQEMWKIISETLRRCSTVPTVTTDA